MITFINGHTLLDGERVRLKGSGTQALGYNRGTSIKEGSQWSKKSSSACRISLKAEGVL